MGVVKGGASNLAGYTKYRTGPTDTIRLHLTSTIVIHTVLQKFTYPSTTRYAELIGFYGTPPLKGEFQINVLVLVPGLQPLAKKSFPFSSGVNLFSLGLTAWFLHSGDQKQKIN